MTEDFLHLPPVSLTLMENLELRISPRIFEKITSQKNGGQFYVLNAGGNPIVVNTIP
jgi:hypothetical protein